MRFVSVCTRPIISIRADFAPSGSPRVVIPALCAEVKVSMRRKRHLRPQLHPLTAASTPPIQARPAQVSWMRLRSFPEPDLHRHCNKRGSTGFTNIHTLSRQPH